ncbi:MAG: class I SAM-dependent RNA methyltransferase [Trueperaceae bacterium]|nr:class I SAM-dependent RNA methyltransferase [Trueperaceae bacterium]
MSDPEQLTEQLSERGLERRLKRHLKKEPQHFLAVCSPGFEPYLAAEAARLPNVDSVETVTGGVSFRGPLDTVYHANLWLRTAHRVLLRIDDFLAQSYPMLFDHARKVPWELYLGFEQTVNISVSAKVSRLRHRRKIADTVHGGMLARLEPLGLHPNLDPSAPLDIFARLFQDRCTLSLNTSGVHLHKRGYRLATAKAPLRETLAAGLLRAADAEVYDVILDPMCGSGTFLIEAALLARQCPPGGQRDFAFEAMPSFQQSKWERLQREAYEQARPQSPVTLIGFDLNAGAIDAATGNATRAEVSGDLTLQQGDALQLDYNRFKMSHQRGLIICNPPYGARIGGRDEAAQLYSEFVRQLQKTARGWDVAVVTPDVGWMEGLEPTLTLPFRNGGIQVSLVQSEIS